ncbi:MAG: hypothetical protein DMF85_18355 [Acidobacteria bacterium]|nr:MAG: hypothetical protein DMF85_18355 [Acidobacteriota bacterium]
MAPRTRSCSRRRSRWISWIARRITISTRTSDHTLVEFCATIPSSLKLRSVTKKYLLKQVARDLVPEGVLNHRKQGFASPMAAWLRGDLREYLCDTLSPRRLAVHGLFDEEGVRTLIDAHMSRRESHDRQLFALVMFQNWYERFM